MRKTSTFLVSLWLVFGFLCTLAHAGSLDGKSFSGNQGMMGEKANETNEITFANGTFSSAVCTQYGSSGAPYQEKVEGGKIHFVADTYGEKYGRIIWAGTVDGKRMDATYIWYDKGEYQRPEQLKWFSGTTK